MGSRNIRTRNRDTPRRLTQVLLRAIKVQIRPIKLPRRLIKGRLQRIRSKAMASSLLRCSRSAPIS